MRVLILCTGNSARSQMAETIMRHVSHGAIQVDSAGSAPQPEIHPMARQAVLNVLELDMGRQFAKSVDRFVGEQFDCVFTVCDRAAESCPVFPGSPERIHLSFEDPAQSTGSHAERQRAFDLTARELLTRIRLWLSLPSVQQRVGSPNMS